MAARWWRPRGCSPAPSPGSTRSGSSRWQTTWSGVLLEPHWSRKRAAAVATGGHASRHPVLVGRTVDYGRIAPRRPASVFIRHAWWRATGTPAPVLSTPTASSSRTSRSSSTGRGPGPRGGPRTPGGVLRAADPVRRGVGTPLRQLVEAHVAPAARNARLHRGNAAPLRRPRWTRRLPRPRGAGGLPCRCRTRSSRERRPTASPSTSGLRHCTRWTRHRSPGRGRGCGGAGHRLIKTLPSSSAGSSRPRPDHARAVLPGCVRHGRSRTTASRARRAERELWAHARSQIPRDAWG